MELAPMGAGKGGASGSQRERKTGRGMQPGDDNIPGEGVMTTNATEEVPGSVVVRTERGKEGETDGEAAFCA